MLARYSYFILVVYCNYSFLSIIILLISTIENVIDEFYFEGIVDEFIFWYSSVTILVHGLEYRLRSQYTYSQPTARTWPDLDAGSDTLLAPVPGLGELQETQHQLVDLLHVDAAAAILIKHIENPTRKGS